jgi:hypothetical protein
VFANGTAITDAWQSNGKLICEKSLRRMIQFAEVSPDERILVSLVQELTWTHFIALLHFCSPAAGWATRQTSSKVQEV